MEKVFFVVSKDENVVFSNQREEGRLIEIIPSYTEYVKMQTPYLILRGSIQSHDINKGLGKNVRWDYMGSAEFEFGAIPIAMNKLMYYYDHDKYKLERIDGINLWVYHKFNDEDFKKYSSIIEDLYLNQYSKHMLKEVFSYNMPRETNEIWFDMDNLVFISKDKKFMKNINKYLNNSYIYMDIDIRDN